MPQSFGTRTTVVRRKGDLDTVKEEYMEKVIPPSIFRGNRRSRQIARRHWVRQTDDGWCTSGDSWYKRTKNEPGRKKEGLHVVYDMGSDGSSRYHVYLA